MAKKSKRVRKKRHIDTFRYVFLDLSAKDLEPDKITKTLGIQPDSSCRRGLIKDQDGKVIKDRNGKPRRWLVGTWILDAHVHGNFGLEAQIKDILEQIRPKKAIMRRILKSVDATLTIVVEPNRDSCTAAYFLPAALISEFTSLGINVEFRFDSPQIWDELRREIPKKHRQAKRKIGRKTRPCVKYQG